MPIFGIIAIAFLFAGIAALLVFLAYTLYDCSRYVHTNGTPWLVAGLVATVLVWVGSTFIGIGIDTNEERLFIAQYEAQKEVIESSLESDVLTGFERVELVKQASELNGELAKRKAKYEIWYYVTYDEGLYDNVEPIELK
jgi:hypothetical protein